MANPIKIYRKAKGLKQAELADRVGVARVTVVAWEVGRYTPSPQWIPKLAEVLGVEPQRLSREVESFKASAA